MSALKYRLKSALDERSGKKAALRSSGRAAPRSWSDRPDRVGARLRWSLWCCFLLGSQLGSAQGDSTRIYDRIHQWSEKNKVTRWIYSGIFVPPRDEAEPAPQAPRTRRVNPFIRYEGKVVRHIAVHTFDPFGYSVDDTTRRPVSGLQAWGNSLHRSTRASVVRDLLLVRPMRPLDPLQLSESERVLRTQAYVNDARIEVRPVAGTKDSVDLVVLVHDRWSIDADAEGDLGGGSVRLRERNLMGWGQTLEQRLGVHLDRPQLDWVAQHQVPNIGRTYVSGRLDAAITADGDRLGVALDRPFITSAMRWAGGFSWRRSWSRLTVAGPTEGDRHTYGLSSADLDTWTARSFIMGDGSDLGSRSSNYILAARYAQGRYLERPPAAVDTMGYYRNSAMFFLGGGLSIRQYYKERYLFRFGASEDVPEGLLLRLVTGVRRMELRANEPYAGLEVRRGRNYEGVGYLDLRVGIGGFFQGGTVHDGTIRGDLLYFSDLRSLGGWHLRQFIRASMVYGIARSPTTRLTVNGDQLYGFYSAMVQGTRKEVVNFETVFYAPYDLLGFRIAPVLLIGLATIGNEPDPLFSGHVYGSWNIGLLVRNENLLAGTFEVSLGIYPYLPDRAGAEVALDKFSNWSARTTDMVFGPPAPVPYD